MRAHIAGERLTLFGCDFKSLMSLRTMQTHQKGGAINIMAVIIVIVVVIVENIFLVAESALTAINSCAATVAEFAVAATSTMRSEQSTIFM